LKKVLLTLILAVLGFSILTCFTPNFTAQGATNVLANSGFENSLTSWSVVPGTATYTVDSTTKHSGASSVMGVETSSGNIGRLYQDVTGVLTPGQEYQISGWIKTSGVVGSVVIGLDYVDSNFYTPTDGHVNEIGHVSGTQDWTYFESPTFTLPSMPSDASALYFLFDFNAGYGTAWFDDVALTGPSAASPAPSSSPSESWYMFGHDLTNARYSTSNAPKTSHLLWQATLDNAVRSSITISGSTAYVGTMSGNVYALDAITGSTLWTYNTGTKIFTTPTVANGMVYVGSADNWNYYALNAADGSLAWSFHTGGGTFSSVTVVNNIAYIGSTDKNMYALDANNGNTIWTFTSAGEIRDSPAVVDGVIYFGCFVGSTDVGSGNLYALNAATGTEIWSSPTGDSDTYSNSCPAVVGGVVYVGSTDHHLYAFKASDGTQIWNFPTPAKVSSSPAVHNGIVYVGCESGDFYAINAATGTQVWTAKAGGIIYSSPAIADGVVYVGGYGDDTVYAFDASSGSILWSHTTGNGVFSSPTISGGVMFVGSYDSSVYAFGTSFTPGSTSDQTSPSEAIRSAWAPSPVNGAAASVVCLGAVSAAAVVVAAATTVPATAATGGFFDKIIDKVRELIPETFKKWLESFIKSKRKLKIEEKEGSPFLPTKSEIIVYAVSILTLTFSFAYVKVGSINEFLVVLPTFIATSLIVGLVKTYILTVYTRKRGVWAEYKLWYFGIAMFLISTIAFKTPFSSPTRKVNHSKNFTERLGYLLSITAIFVTLAFAAVFFVLLISGFALIGGTGLAMCLISAFFETFPIKPMGGVEIYKYNKVMWAILFLGTLSLYAAWIAHAI
jgi:eukaryotic-like serine/threonine-protein kinase